MRFFQDLPKRTEKNSPKQQSGEDSNRYVWWYVFWMILLSKKMPSKKNALEIHGFFQELSNRTCFGFGSVVPWNRTDPEWNRTVKPNRTVAILFFPVKVQVLGIPGIPSYHAIHVFFEQTPIFSNHGGPQIHPGWGVCKCPKKADRQNGNWIYWKTTMINPKSYTKFGYFHREANVKKGVPQV